MGKKIVDITDFDIQRSYRIISYLTTQYYDNDKC
jgi:hypothetical protein